LLGSLHQQWSSGLFFIRFKYTPGLEVVYREAVRFSALAGVGSGLPFFRIVELPPFAP